MNFTDFDINKLLERDGIESDLDGLSRYYKGKNVLVTGGGGSVGSEICRTLVALSVRSVIIFDIYENLAYELFCELSGAKGQSGIFVEVGSIRDVKRLDALFEKYRPDIVFHAAAHKHVPLMETNPDEAMKNNVIGTYNVMSASEKFGVEKFVLISTDKAKNSTSIMGASKRLAEILTECHSGKTVFSSVRFGNVLGSAGSVLPIFIRQIREGGPLTLTDKRMMRYFMTPREAVSLVLSAGAMAQGGEIFSLDMGDPVNMYSLAWHLIELFGLQPEVDIEIKEVGIRKGEKLFEEALCGEGYEKTENGRVFMKKQERGRELLFEKIIEDVSSAVTSYTGGEGTAIVDVIKKYVPDYREK